MVEVLAEGEADPLPMKKCWGSYRGLRPEWMPWSEDSLEIMKTSVSLRQKKLEKLLRFLLT